MPISQAEFDALCEELSANNPDRGGVTSYELPPGYGFRLGQALRHNTVVSHLALDLRPFQVDGENDNTGWRAEDNISMILQFLGSSMSLHSVTFTHGTPVYTNQCIQALSQNPNLQKFALVPGVDVSAAVLAEWLGTTQSLRELILPSAVADDDQVAAALGTNSSITSLYVDCMFEFSKASFLGPIGCRVTPTRLQDLSLSGCVLSPDVLAALCWFASSSTTTLPSLSIENFLIDSEFSMFVNALSARPCMIAKLQLVNVSRNETIATDILSSVMAQQVRSSRSSTGTGSSSSSSTGTGSSSSSSTGSSSSSNATAAIIANATFQEIVVTGYGYLEQSAELKMVTALTLNAQFTLERLDWEWFNAQNDEMDHSLLWTNMEEQICTHGPDSESGLPFRRLREIVLDKVLTSNNDAMLRCLPKLVSLEKLISISSPDEHGQPYSSTERLRFAAAIRGNGSLTTLKMDDQVLWSTNPTQAARVEAIVDAVLQRNKMLPKLLSRPPSSAGKSHEDDTDRVQREGRYPHLFAVALPAESMSPNFVLMGLNALGHDATDKLPPEKRSAPRMK